MRVCVVQGETISQAEATSAFFATTKLFQSGDKGVRRLVYLVIAEMADKATDTIIVTSSLTKDMTGKEDIFRAPALRALCRITDACAPLYPPLPSLASLLGPLTGLFTRALIGPFTRSPYDLT